MNKSKINDEILKKYLKTHRTISDRQLSEIKEQISRNIDLSVYQKLGEYDKENGFSDKQAQYINIMLKHYRKNSDESLKDYEERVASQRKTLLESYNIEASPKTRQHLSFNRFGISEGMKKIKVSDKVKATSQVKKLKEDAQKSPKKFFGKILDSFKISKSKIKISAPKGFFQKLKDKKEKNPEQFKKSRLKVLIASGVIALAATGLVAGFHGNQKSNPNPASETSIEYFDDSESETPSGSYTVPKQSENENSNIAEKEASGVTSKETTSETEKEPEIVIESDITEPENGKTTKTESKVEIIDESETQKESVTSSKTSPNFEKSITYSASEAARKIIKDLNINFNSTFKIQNGNYYETPEETGKYGNYSNFNSNSLKITYVDVITETGVTQYNAYTGLSISKIIAQNPNAKFSYHVETVDGNVLGWNSETSNNIEMQMVLGHIKELKSYISSEDMEYLNSLDFEKLSDQNIKKVSSVIKEAENTRNVQTQDTER